MSFPFKVKPILLRTWPKILTFDYFHLLSKIRCERSFYGTLNLSNFFFWFTHFRIYLFEVAPVLHVFFHRKVNISRGYRALIWEPFKKPRNRFLAWRIDYMESIPGLHKVYKYWLSTLACARVENIARHFHLYLRFFSPSLNNTYSLKPEILVTAVFSELAAAFSWWQ